MGQRKKSHTPVADPEQGWLGDCPPQNLCQSPTGLPSMLMVHLLSLTDERGHYDKENGLSY